MFCSKCANQIPDDANFCNKCGNSVKKLQEQQAEPVTTAPSMPNYGVHNSGDLQYSEVNQEAIKEQKKPSTGKFRLIIPQVGISIILAAFICLFAFFEHSVIINTAETSNLFVGDFSFFHVINSLLFGAGRYNPSVLSIVMGTAVAIMIFTASFFWLLSLIATLIKKGENGIRRIAVILTFLTLGSVCVLPHLAYKFIPQFKYMYAGIIGILPADLKGMSSTLSYVWAGISVSLIVAVYFFVFKRNKQERSVKENG